MAKNRRAFASPAQVVCSGGPGTSQDDAGAAESGRREATIPNGAESFLGSGTEILDRREAQEPLRYISPGS